MRLGRSLAVAALLLLVGLAEPLAAPLSGQFQGYFGRNKVQYENFDFRVLETEHFDLHYYEEEREAAQMAGRMLERWYARLSRILNHEFRERQPVILYANHPHFEQTNATPEQIGEGTGGFTEILKRRIVLPMAGAPAESDHVLGHELVHAFQFDMTGQGTTAVGLDIPGALRLPLWFIEGMAEYLSLGPIDPFTTMWLRDAVAEDDLPTLSDLRNPRYFPYRYGHALWSFIAGRWGEDRISRILKLAGRSGNAPGALAAVLEVHPDTLSQMWHESIREYYRPVMEATRPADAFGRRVLHEETTGGELNLGPALSPDGEEVVFLSERSLFAVEMYLGDVRTGEVKRKITQSALDPHYESLQYINSSGSWHPDGRRFVFSGISKGEPILTILDIRNGRKLREFRLEGMGEIFAPQWGPDGRRIAFAAQTDGFLDLHLLDAETGETTRLTRDPFGDMQPTWAPDGRALVFVTDRFDADLDDLRFGGYGLARLDLASGEVEALPGLGPGWDAWDPHFAPDGESVYFVSDYQGIRNVYRLSLADGGIRQVTNLQTGVSGISKLSPALSVASGTGQVAVTIYQGGPFKYDVYMLEDGEVLAGEPVPDRISTVNAGVLPPRDRYSEELVALLQNPRLGLADSLTFEARDYDASLSLDFIGQPTLAVAASDFGFFFAGGGSLFFSDMLGDKNLFTLLQVNTSRGDFVKGTAALAGYEDRDDRWNWGVVGGQVPLITRFFRSGIIRDATSGDDILVFSDFRFFQIERQLGGTIAYPFSRAQRVEFSASARAVDFAAELREIGIDAAGRIRFDREVEAPTCLEGEITQFCAPESLVLTSASAALVYDNSIFGGTSPLLGQRYRIEARPTLGSLNYLSLLGDFRKYFMLLRPLNFAVRGLHFGRYGSDGEDPRLSQLFLGFPSLVRGYDDRSFDIAECRIPTTAPFAACPVFDQLLGSRIAVANAELRLPILGGIGLIPSPGFPPIEIGAFADAGVAWTSGLAPCLDAPQTPGDEADDCREPVKSVGFLTRINLFGFAVAEIDFVNPIDRPDQDWFWQFALQPGF